MAICIRCITSHHSGSHRHINTAHAPTDAMKQNDSFQLTSALYCVRVYLPAELDAGRVVRQVCAMHKHLVYQCDVVRYDVSGCIQRMQSADNAIATTHRQCPVQAYRRCSKSKFHLRYGEYGPGPGRRMLWPASPPMYHGI